MYERRAQPTPCRCAVLVGSVTLRLRVTFDPQVLDGALYVEDGLCRPGNAPGSRVRTAPGARTGEGTCGIDAAHLEWTLAAVEWNEYPPGEAVRGGRGFVCACCNLLSPKVAGIE